MKIIQSEDFDSYWKSVARQIDDTKTDKTVKKIIADVRAGGTRRSENTPRSSINLLLSGLKSLWRKLSAPLNSYAQANSL